MIPKLSSPLTKGIRTTEGVLTTIVGGLIVIVSGIDPHTLPRKEGAIVTAALAGLYVLQRGLIKVVALQKGFGVGAPIDNAKLDQTVAAITDHAAAIDAVATKLGNVDFTKMPTQAQLEDLLKKLEQHANTNLGASTSAPSGGGGGSGNLGAGGGGSVTTGPSDPVEAAAAAVTSDEEAATQPSGEDLASAFPPPPNIADGSAATPDPPAEAASAPVTPASASGGTSA